MKKLNKQEIELLKPLVKAYGLANLSDTENNKLSSELCCTVCNPIADCIRAILKDEDLIQVFFDGGYNLNENDFYDLIWHCEQIANEKQKEIEDIEKAKKELENNQYTEIRNLKKLNIEYFKLNENSNTIYFINHYLKGYNEYSISKFTDCNSERFVKPSKKVFIDFTF